MNEEYFNINDLNLEESTLSTILNQEPIKDEDQVSSEQSNEKDDIENDNIENIEEIDNAPSSESQEDSSTFSVFANLLKEEGVFSLEDDELKNIKTSKDLVEAVKNQIEKSKYNNLSASQKRYLESVDAGIPQSEFEKLEKQLNSLEKITDDTLNENKQARFDLIAYDYIEKGISKEKAIELANRSIKLGTDIEDAKEALESLIKIKSEEYKKTILSRKEENEVSLEKLKEEINKKDFILEQIKQTPKQKEELFNLLSTKVDTDELGQPLNALNKWRKDNKLEAEIILGAIYLQTNKFKNLGKILEVSKSKAALELENKLRQHDASGFLNEKTNFGNNKKYEINI